MAENGGGHALQCHLALSRNRPELEEISGQAGQLTEIFSNLELSDEATYQALVAIVDNATRRNQSVGEIVERVRALGDAAEEVVGVIESMTPAGALSALGKALKR